MMKLKKLFFATTMFTVASCSLFTEEQSVIPAEYAGADYELSDVDAQKWAFKAKQAEQCIYPNLTRIQYEHFQKEDSYIYSQYVFFYPLEDIIGEDNVKIIQNDEKAMKYATYQLKKYKSRELVEPLQVAECKTLQTKAREDLAVVKGQHITGMVEEAKADGKGSGVATEQNKFFFDIIKWGSALFLL